MLGLVTLEDGRDILFEQGANATYKINLMAAPGKFVQNYMSRPGFFSPYRARQIHKEQKVEKISGTQEFVGELIAPVVYPTALALVSGRFAITTALGLVIGIGSLMVAGVMAIFQQTKLRDDAFQFAMMGLMSAGRALVISAISALLAFISIPHSLISIVTRSAATGLDALAGCCAKTTDNHPASLYLVANELLAAGNNAEIDSDQTLKL